MKLNTASICLSVTLLFVAACDRVDDRRVAASVDTKNPISVDLATLSQANDENSLKAEDDYVEKSLLIHGDVSSVSRGFGDDLIVGVVSDGAGALCYFSTQERQKLLDLKEGYHVEVIGKCESLSGLISMRGCVLKSFRAEQQSELDSVYNLDEVDRFFNTQEQFN